MESQYIITQDTPLSITYYTIEAILIIHHDPLHRLVSLTAPLSPHHSFAEIYSSTGNAWSSFLLTMANWEDKWNNRKRCTGENVKCLWKRREQRVRGERMRVEMEALMVIVVLVNRSRTSLCVSSASVQLAARSIFCKKLWDCRKKTQAWHAWQFHLANVQNFRFIKMIKKL